MMPSNNFSHSICNAHQSSVLNGFGEKAICLGSSATSTFPIPADPERLGRVPATGDPVIATNTPQKSGPTNQYLWMLWGVNEGGKPAYIPSYGCFVHWDGRTALCTALCTYAAAPDMSF